MTNLLSELEAVVGLAEKATPGEWTTALHGLPENHWLVADCGGSRFNRSNPLVVAEVRDYCMAAEDDAAYVAALHNLFRTRHAEIAAAVRDASGKRSEWWSVQQDDELQASSDSLPDALHYLSVYQQDGPAQLVHVVTYSETITPEQIAADLALMGVEQ